MQQKLEQKIPIFNFAFGLLVVIGGAIGYAKAKSLPSLGAGLFFGNLLMLSIWGTDFGNKSESTKSKTWGLYLAVLVSVALLIFFVIRLMKTGKPFPASIIIFLSIIGVIGNSLLLHNKSIKKENP